jgi:hypothetical protein
MEHLPAWHSVTGGLTCTVSLLDSASLASASFPINHSIIFPHEQPVSCRDLINSAVIVGNVVVVVFSLLTIHFMGLLHRVSVDVEILSNNRGAVGDLMITFMAIKNVVRVATMGLELILIDMSGGDLGTDR